MTTVTWSYDYQRIYIQTDVGPEDVYNYCAVPEWSFTGEGDLPSWFVAEGNKLKVYEEDGVSGAFTIAGSIAYGSLTADGTVNVYIDDYSYCADLPDGAEAAAEFIAWLASEEGINSYDDLSWYWADRELDYYSYYWWTDVKEIFSVGSAIDYFCDDFMAAWDGALDDWANPSE
uniref:Uncharacterized protein n=1 Tax=Strombidinopsis acuminata TaxID=141414 RepID=A0A7S3RDS3_9SPIT|mmetsp:Transcript_10373/g.14299  ORF Transcript_10373/g.14299 Transcript_10373/m.14299 type:complete len:174 (+) Transcript_10373:933-1454(+)